MIDESGAAWKEATDASSGKAYFWNVETGTVTWENPTPPSAASLAGVVAPELEATLLQLHATMQDLDELIKNPKVPTRTRWVLLRLRGRVEARVMDARTGADVTQVSRRDISDANDAICDAKCTPRPPALMITDLLSLVDEEVERARREASLASKRARTPTPPPEPQQLQVSSPPQVSAPSRPDLAAMLPPAKGAALRDSVIFYFCPESNATVQNLRSAFPIGLREIRAIGAGFGEGGGS